MKKLFFLLLIIALCVFLFVPVASAAKFRGGDTFSLDEGEVFHDNLYIGAGTVTIDGTVEKDLAVGGGTVTIDGDVWEDLFVGGGTVIVNGDVGGDLRAGGGTVRIAGRVGGDVLVGGGDISLTKDSVVEGDLVVGGGTVRFAGDAYKKAEIAAGQLEVSGKIREGLKSETDEAPVISSAAWIGGDFVYTSPEKAEIKEGAKVEGKVTHKLPKTRKGEKRDKGVAILFAILGFLLWKAIFLIAMFVTGVVLILLFPKWTENSVSTILEKPWPSLGIGILLFIVVPIVALVLSITVIGLPLGFMACGLYAALLYISWIIVGCCTGQFVIGLFKKEGKSSLYWSLALGLLVLMVIMLIPIVNVLAYIAIVAFGLGALTLTSFECYKKAKEKELL